MSKTTRTLILSIVIATLSLPVTANAGNLTVADQIHLIFMRSEEKLARDVYITLGEKYPEASVFKTIARNAEQTHTDTMQKMLVKFGIPDPEEHTAPVGVFPEPDDPNIGMFDNYYFADYFAGKFNDLTGPKNLRAALYVGGLIEELDMKDIDYCNEKAFYDEIGNPIVAGLPTDPLDCGGLSTTGVKALHNSLDSLLSGSESHLCAFINNIINKTDDECYTVQYLSEDEVEAHLLNACPELTGIVCYP